MAIKFLSGLSVDGNITLENSAQLKSARIENDNSAPAGTLGRLYYDTGTNKLRLYNGSWVDIDTGTDGDTTYDLSGVGSTNGSAGVRLAGSDGTNDDVLIVGAGTVGVTRSGNTLTVTGTDSAAGTVTSVSGGTGITITGTSTVNPTVNIDYAGSDNAILASPSTATPVGGDTMWFSDATDSGIKKSLISDFPGFGKDGTVTSVTAGTGLVLESGSATVAPTIGVDYAGSDNVILEATDGTSLTLASTDKVIFSDATDSNVKYANISQLSAAIGGGTVTSVGLSAGTTGLSVSSSTTNPITVSGTFTLAGTLKATNGGTGASSYTVGDILYADSTTSLAKLGIGTPGQVLKVASGVPSWAADTDTGLTSVGITETGSALTITNTPLTSNGNINIAGAGSASQVILGNLTLATLPVDGVTSVTAGNGLSITSGSSTVNPTLTVGSTAGGGITVGTTSIGVDNTVVRTTGAQSIAGIKTFSNLPSIPLTPVATTDAASKNYVDTQLAGSGVLIFQGGYNAATNVPDLDSSPSASIKKGWSYVVTNDGTFFTEQVRAGDFLIANSDSPTALSDWTTVQSNIDLASTTTPGIASFSSDNFAVSAAGQVTVKNGGININELDFTPNTIIGTDTDYSNPSGIQVLDAISLTDGVVTTAITKRNLPTTSQSNLGVIEMADTSEVTAGSSTVKGISPATLKTHLDADSYSGTFPSGSSATWTVAASTHGLSTGPFIVQCYNSSGNQLFIETAINGSGDISFTATSAQSSGSVRVNVMKVR